MPGSPLVKSIPLVHDKFERLLHRFFDKLCNACTRKNQPQKPLTEALIHEVHETLSSFGQLVILKKQPEKERPASLIAQGQIWSGRGESVVA